MRAGHWIIVILLAILLLIGKAVFSSQGLEEMGLVERIGLLEKRVDVYHADSWQYREDLGDFCAFGKPGWL